MEKKFSFKLFFKVIIQMLIVYSLVDSTFYCYNNLFTKQTYQDCGAVISKEVVGLDRLLTVSFKKRGIESVNVTEKTYLSNKVGDIVCFSFNKEPEHNFINFIRAALGLIGFLILVLITIFLIIEFFKYIFNVYE